MDISRRDRDRVFHLGSRGNIHVTKYSTEEDEDPSPIARPYAQLDRSRPLLKNHFYSSPSPGTSTSRRFHGEHPYLTRNLAYDDDSNVPSNNVSSTRDYPYPTRSPVNDDDSNAPPNNIPSLLPSEDERNSGPRPLFSDDMVQKLRESLRRTAARHEDLSSIEWECEFDENTYSPPDDAERMTYEEYLEEEEKTKQTIDEIIMVAQALRKKIQREEDIRRASAAYRDRSNASALIGASTPMHTPKPKIPSLLELHVEPPEEIFLGTNRYEPEYPPEYQEVEFCWNCDRRGHRYINCKHPKMRNFCYRCGKRGYDMVSCPACNL